jgi:hypothetical protein
MKEWYVNDENGKDLEGSDHGLILRYYPSICPEGLRKHMQIISYNSQSLGRDFNLGPTKYKAGALTTKPQHSVLLCMN